MKKITIAFLYNVQHICPNPDNPDSWKEADLDDIKTIKSIENHLKNCGYDVIPIEADEYAYFKLHKNKKKIDLVFNYAEGLYGEDRELQIPAMLEMLKIPYTGPPPLTQGLVLNKAKAKEIFIANNIPTPASQVFNFYNEDLNKKLKFPLIVKPIAEGSSAGITNLSVVSDMKKLKSRIRLIIETFSSSALVETFLTGRDFTVGMIGNPPKILPIVEYDHKHIPSNYLPLYSMELKSYLSYNNMHNRFCPAPVSKSLRKKISDLCFRAWNSLGLSDWCRLDIRCDDKENPYILEVNVPSVLTPPEIYTPSLILSANVVGMEYDDVLKTIINSARKRYGI